MRLNHIDLIRYGRFTERRIDLPLAECDFHVIVGPNEAGKSTLRSAIGDLLYGIPARTSLAFLHAMPELRLGAGLMARPPAGQGAVVEIQRVKGNKQTLRDARDQPLSDNALAPFIGTADRAFFGQMFSLDHARMVQGGRGILSATDNLGQILFQSAAGINTLGSVRDALQAQADQLWSPRRSKDRQYYIAADALEAATAELKQATVRAKDWSQAHDARAAADQALQQLREQQTQVRERRTRLERLRRVLPALTTMQQALAALDQLGTVTELPEDAARVHHAAQRAIQTEQVAIDHHQDRLAQAAAALAQIAPDTTVLAAAEEITALNEQRLQYRAYAVDMPRREAERDALWRVVQGQAAQLGWSASDVAAVQALLPAAPLRASLRRLARERAALQQAADAAERAVRKKQSERDGIQAELAQLPVADEASGLRLALARVKRLGDVDAAMRAAQGGVDRQAAALDAALAGLGPWRMPLPALQAMTPPAGEHLQALAQAGLQDEVQVRALVDRIAQLDRQHQQASLEARQFQASHDTVSRDEVLDARRARDASWEALKADAAGLAAHGDSFVLQMTTADALADRRHDTAQEASELQGRLAQVERVALELRQARDALAAVQAGIAQRQAHWAALATACGLPGLPFDAAVTWLAARAAALEAGARLSDAQTELDRWHHAVAEACGALGDVLQVSPGARGAADLDRLAAQVEARTQAADTLRGRRMALDKQLADADAAMRLLQDEAQAARQALAAWSDQWLAQGADAGFPAESGPALVEARLALMEEMAQGLDAIRRIQVDRIDKMQADRDLHAAMAEALLRRLHAAAGQGLDHAPGRGDAIALALAGRLEAARAAQTRAAQLRAEMATAEQAMRDATLRRAQAEAGMAPLCQQAGVAMGDALAAAIERSDRARALRTQLATAERTAIEAGDGLSLAQLQAEAASADAAALAGELSGLANQEDGLLAELSAVSARRQSASEALQAIGGVADAAAAESRRQQALAAMADAVERYVKVYTAVRLLRWSIEQYREAKQGPMLSAASAVFAQLTRGSFDRLVVDFEHEPPRLQGRRPDGGLVDIEGMSEGTQDQLFLALRLAALDLHLAHAPAMPFIADDLFINYDDARARGGLHALAALSRKTQVLFLTHHDHLLPVVREVLGEGVNVVRL